MTIELSLFHLPILLAFIAGIVMLVVTTRPSFIGFYGLEAMLSIIFPFVFTACYYGAYYWFVWTALECR